MLDGMFLRLDESKAEVVDFNNMTYVWRDYSEGYSPENTTGKHGVGSIRLWGRFDTNISTGASHSARDIWNMPSNLPYIKI